MKRKLLTIMSLLLILCFSFSSTRVNAEEIPSDNEVDSTEQKEEDNNETGMITLKYSILLQDDTRVLTSFEAVYYGLVGETTDLPMPNTLDENYNYELLNPEIGKGVTFEKEAKTIEYIFKDVSTSVSIDYINLDASKTEDKQLGASDVIQGKVGSSYTVELKKFDGYKIKDIKMYRDISGIVENGKPGLIHSEIDCNSDLQHPIMNDFKLGSTYYEIQYVKEGVKPDSTKPVKPNPPNTGVDANIIPLTFTVFLAFGALVITSIMKYHSKFQNN